MRKTIYSQLPAPLPKGRGWGWLFILLSLFVSCDKAENSIYREYACNFIFDATLHPAPCQLTMILGNPGQFAIVSSSFVSGITHLRTTRNYDHAQETIPLTTKRESQVNQILGAHNAIIIGCSSYTNQLICYEGQCRNCLDAGGVDHPLTFSDNGQQLCCAHCHRTYDVNNGVVATGDPGRQLYTYAVNYDGSVLRAWN
jgi:hypothetical protein